MSGSDEVDPGDRLGVSEEGEGRSGNPSRFLLALSFLASSSSLRAFDSSARQRRFSSRAAARKASSSSSFRFLVSFSSLSRWMAAWESK